MRKFLIALLLISFPSMASNYTLIGNWPYSFFEPWYTNFSNDMCGSGMLAVGFTATRDDGGIFTFLWQEFACVPAGGVNIPPWGGSTPPSSVALPAPPAVQEPLLYLDSVNYNPYVGLDISGDVRGSSSGGNWHVTNGNRRDWSDIYDHGTDPTSSHTVNSFFKENIENQTDTIIDAVGISTNLTARRIAYAQESIEQANRENYALHYYTSAAAMQQSAASAQHVVNEVSHYVNAQNQFMANEFISLESTITDLEFDSGELEYNLYGAIWDAANSTTSYLWDTEWILWTGQQDIKNQNSAILDAIESSSGGGGGLSEEFAAGLIGDYEGDGFNESEFESILGTGGLSVGDLESGEVSLDDFTTQYFNFSASQCYEPIELSFSVFGMESTVEINMNPFCDIFNVIGVLFLIASHLAAVRIVVGAF